MHNMQLKNLHKKFDKLQQEYGSPKLDSIYGAGCTSDPDVCFVFINPTGKNVSSAKSWKGLKAPWLGTKNIWKLFNSIGVLSGHTLKEILSKRSNEWDYEFSEKIYRELSDNKVYITNLGKCTKDDACHVSDSVFKKYLGLLEEEIEQINPKKIITFGNQVSSLFLSQSIKISEVRKQCKIKKIDNKEFKTFPVYYPIGNGMRNYLLAIEDICFAIRS
jgi:DNA polymerase